MSTWHPARAGHRRGIRRTFFRPDLESLEPRLAMALAVPALSSLPGANHTIYLDFDGHVTAGTSWNSSYGVTSINSPAYSSDADPANFSDAELAVIQNTWRRVAEDFAPFQVNVTTVEPVATDLAKSGTGDTRWGVRTVVTKDVAFGCGCGGIAYIDSFNWSNDTPVYVFNTSELGVAEAASHEVGHSLGLSHDGTATASYYQGHGSGATSWAPIMGVGYYVNVSQWDKGEYTGSNNAGSGANYGKGPDDLAIITSYNGFGYRADDHGNTDATASALGVSGTTVTGTGNIERTADLDVFQFTTGAGTVSLNVNPAALGANLDIKAELFDSTGAFVASSNPAATLNASFNVSLNAGTYYLRIEGVGVGAPTANPPTGYSDYASLGQYSISGTIVPSNLAVVSVVATDASKNEGNSGSTAYTFTVSRTGNLSVTSTVNYAVAGSGASPAGALDFTGAVLPSGTLTFQPDEATKVITIDVAGETTVEGNESFQVSLSQPNSTTSIGQGVATGTILNDDVTATPPKLNLSATSANQSEGTGATPTPFLFTVTRSGDASGSASVTYKVSRTGSKAANGADFGGSFPTGTVAFAPGQVTADIIVKVTADSVKEPNETFRVTLSNAVGAALGTTTANGTIVNDDGTTTTKFEPQGTDRAYEPDEGDSGEFLIAVADPMWYFDPSTTAGIGLSDAMEMRHAAFGHDDVHADAHGSGENHGLERSFAEVFALLHGRPQSDMRESALQFGDLAKGGGAFATMNALRSERESELGTVPLNQATRDHALGDDDSWDAVDDAVVDDVAAAREKKVDSPVRVTRKRDGDAAFDRAGDLNREIRRRS